MFSLEGLYHKTPSSNGMLSYAMIQDVRVMANRVTHLIPRRTQTGLNTNLIDKLTKYYNSYDYKSLSIQLRNFIY